MWIYNFLSKIGFLNKFAYKVFFVSSLGVILPMSAMSIYFYFSSQSTQFSPGMLVAVVIVFTIGAIALSSFFLNTLMAPISLAQNELKRFITTNNLPEFPLHYKDEIGTIFKDLKIGAESINKLAAEKNDFTVMLSHDLRSPMVSIIGLLKLVKDESNKENADYFLSKAEEFGYHQLNLMESILTMYKEESLMESPNKKVNVNLSSILAQSLSQFELTLQSKQLDISQNIPPSLEVNVEPYSFSQVITNLLHNAIKFSRKGDQIVVDVTSESDRVNIAVRDEGIGFSLDNPNILFQRFTPERKRGTDGEPTNGLGLYLSKKIIEKHHGSISAESAGNNKGATFKVNIPN